MNDHSRDKSMTYTLVHRGEEFTFAIDRHGNGRCICRGNVRGHLKREGNLDLKDLLGDKRARKRIDQLEEEFSFDVVLSESLSLLLWRMYHTADEATVETRAFEREIDRMLGEIIGGVG